MRRAAPAHLAPRHVDAAKTCKNQCADKPLRPKGASERQFALSRPRRSAVTVGILHVFWIECSRFISDFSGAVDGSPVAPRRSSAKANNLLVEPCCGLLSNALEAEHRSRKHDLSTTSLMRSARHLLSKEELRSRAEHLRNLSRKTPKGEHKKSQLKPHTRPPRYCYSAHTDSEPIALRAQVEAMN